MTQINDAILARTGGPTVSDGLLDYYRENGASADNLDDAEREFLILQGATPAHENDMWFEFLRGLGLTGALDDMKLQYWGGFTFDPDLALGFEFARDKSLTDIAAGLTLDFTRASTATYVGADRLIKTAAINEPRFDHDPATGQSLGLLIEEARTNILRQSESLDATGWSGTGIVDADVAVAPDGATTADRIKTEVGPNTQSYRNQAITVNTSSPYVASIFAKAEGTRWLAIGLLSMTTPANSEAWFDLQNGVVGTVDAPLDGATIEDYGNGWFRCSIYFTTDPVDTAGSLRIWHTRADGDLVAVGDGTGLFMWGASLEQGAFPTSYIPTTTTGVTRAIDACGTTDMSWLNPVVEHTLFVDATHLFRGSNFGRASIAATDNSSYLRDNTTAINFQFVRRDSGQAAANIINFSTADLALVTATRLVQGDIRSAINGVLSTPSADTGLPASALLQRLNVGDLSVGVFSINGHVARLAYFNVGKDDDWLVENTGGTGIPDAPGNLQWAEPFPGFYLLYWDEPPQPVDGYRIYRNGDLYGSTTQTIFVTLETGTYQVQAFVGDLESPLSVPVVIS